MKPGGGGKPSGELLALLERDFTSYEKFYDEFNAAAATQFGAGWAWLACKLMVSVFFFPSSDSDERASHNYFDFVPNSSYISFRRRQQFC